MRRQCSAYKKDGTRCTREVWAATCRQHRNSKNGPKSGLEEPGPSELTLTFKTNAETTDFKDLPAEISSLLVERIKNNVCGIEKVIANRALDPETLIVTNFEISDVTIKPAALVTIGDDENASDDDDGRKGRYSHPCIETIIKPKVTKDPANPVKNFTVTDLQNMLYNFNIQPRNYRKQVDLMLLSEQDWKDVKNHRDYFDDLLRRDIEDDEKDCGLPDDCKDVLEIKQRFELDSINGYKVADPKKENWRRIKGQDRMKTMMKEIFDEILDED